LAVKKSPLPGDYNQNGTVDAADYVVWRKGLGTVYNQNDYNVWRANFGATTAGAAAVAHSATGPAVPEPASAALLLFAVVGSLVVRWSPDRARSRLKVSLSPPLPQGDQKSLLKSAGRCAMVVSALVHSLFDNWRKQLAISD
jgi:hypothetical protein